MSMTESEAIEVLKQPCLCDYDLSHTVETCDISYCDKREATHMAITALSEIQQYREYREIFKSHFTEDALELFSDKEEFSKWFERGKWHVLKCDELGREVEAYRAIGTVSEFRELKEKAMAKKQNDKFEFSPCPRCGSRETLGDGFCYVCGTILD